MFYRRKIILSILQAFGGSLSKTALQKILFLFTSKQSKRDYDFVPYLYGCYSFSANADLVAMVKRGYLIEDKYTVSKIGSVDYSKMLRDCDKTTLVDIKNNFGHLDINSLIKFTYLNYKYYAINSLISKDILTIEQHYHVMIEKPFNNKILLYTIGYEGISLEEYLNRLIKKDVKILIDVRKNALSMKFGFSKGQLKNFCSNLGIEYIHIPEVGIRSDQRQTLNSQSDYDKLFEEYKNTNLKETTYQQEQILSLLKEKKRVALTCFEANICQCHRKHLAESIVKLPGWNYELLHI